jgi:hypothetical protein
MSRFYRAEVITDDGTKQTFSFEAEDIMLAYDHMEHVARQHEGMTVEIVRFIGFNEPADDFGTFKEAA